MRLGKGADSFRRIFLPALICALFALTLGLAASNIGLSNAASSGSNSDGRAQSKEQRAALSAQSRFQTVILGADAGAGGSEECVGGCTGGAGGNSVGGAGGNEFGGNSFSSPGLPGGAGQSGTAGANGPAGQPGGSSHTPESSTMVTPQTQNQQEPTPQTQNQQEPTPQTQNQQEPTPQTQNQQEPTPQTQNQQEPTPQTQNQQEPMVAEEEIEFLGPEASNAEPALPSPPNPRCGGTGDLLGLGSLLGPLGGVLDLLGLC